MIQWLRVYLPMQGTGFDQWFRKILHAVEQLNWSTTITEDHVLQSPSAATPEAACSGVCMPQLERSLHATAKTPRAPTKTGHSPQKSPTRRCHLSPVRVAIVKNNANKCLQGRGETGTLVHCWWECKLVQSLWKTVWSFL